MTFMAPQLRYGISKREERGGCVKFNLNPHSNPLALSFSSPFLLVPPRLLLPRPLILYMAIFNTVGKRKMKSSGKSSKRLSLSVDVMLNWMKARGPKSPSSTNSSPSSSPETSPRNYIGEGVVPTSPRSSTSPATTPTIVPTTPTFALPSDYQTSGLPNTSNPPLVPLKKCVSMDELATVKLIGEGSSSKVYLVRSASDLEVPCTSPYTALKIMAKVESGPTSEGKIMGQLNHPLIVQPLSYFEDATNRYIHMPYVAGGELFHHLRKFKTFNEKIAQFYIAEIVLALEYVHSKNICYRDLKPENILLSKTGHVQLIDFGAAQYVKDIKNLHLAVGTLEYLAPEVVKMKKHEKEADWWALGVLLYEMLTGKLPFTSPLNSEVPTLVLAGKYDVPPHLSDPARSLIKGLLTHKPNKRLGGGKKGAEEIKKHPFFAGIAWDRLLTVEPPIVIQLDGEADTKYFET